MIALKDKCMKSCCFLSCYQASPHRHFQLTKSLRVLLFRNNAIDAFVRTYHVFVYIWICVQIEDARFDTRIALLSYMWWWRRCRTSSPFFAPLFFLFPLLGVTLLIILLMLFGFQGVTWHTFSMPIFNADRASENDELPAPLNNFRPPSPFAAEVCVRRFYQAWCVQSHRTSPLPVASALKRSSAGEEVDSAYPVVRLAYAIQASGYTVALLPRLISHILHERNVYMLHINSKVKMRHQQQLADLIANSSEYALNVYLFSSEMLTCGISSVVHSLALMTLSLGNDTEWDYYFNLSASYYPLVSTEALTRLLARPRVPIGLLNYVCFFPRKEWVPYLFRNRHMFWDPRHRAFHQQRINSSILVASRICRGCKVVRFCFQTQRR